MSATANRRAAPHLAAVARLTPVAAPEQVAPARDLLTVRDVAARLGLSPGRVYQMLDAGEIPHVRRGRSIRVPRLAYDAWQAGLTAEALGGRHA